MNKRVLALIVVFVVVLVVLLIILANRRGDGGGGVTPTPTNTSVRLIFWNLFEPQANIQPLIDAYRLQHPNVEIQYVQKGIQGTDAYRSELTTNLGDGDIVNSPDLYPIHNTWVERFMSLASPAPAATLSSADMDAFYPIVKADFYRNSKVYGVPLYLDSIAIIYNKKLLNAEGYTTGPAKAWSDFELQAQKLTKSEKGVMTQSGFSAFNPDNSQFYFEVFNNLLLQEGASVIERDGKSKLADSQEAKDGVDFYKKFISGNVKTWDGTMPKDIAAFLEGRLAMYAAPSWRLIDILNYNQKYNLGLEVGVATMPQIFQTNETYFPTYWGITVSKDCQHPAEAWDFIKYITQDAQLKKLDETVKANGRPIGILYPRLSLASLNQPDTYLGPYAISLGKSKLWPMYDGAAMKEEFNKLFKTGSVTPDTVQTAINSVLQIKQ